MVISEIATSKNHIELLRTGPRGQIWDRICDPDKILAYCGLDKIR
jgi:hypothetical protein